MQSNDNGLPPSTPTQTPTSNPTPGDAAVRRIINAVDTVAPEVLNTPHVVIAVVSRHLKTPPMTDDLSSYVAGVHVHVLPRGEGDIDAQIWSVLAITQVTLGSVIQAIVQATGVPVHVATTIVKDALDDFIRQNLNASAFDISTDLDEPTA